MNKKISVIFILIVLVAVGGSFYAGMKYQSAQSSIRRVGSGNFTGTFAVNGRTGAGGGLVVGQVIAKDSQSLTLSLRTGSTQIIFVSGSTQISKMAAGSLSDISVGTNVSVNGTANPDGSLNAQTIQIRPASTTAPFTTGQNQSGQ